MNAPRIKRSIRLAVRGYGTGQMHLLGRVIISSDGGIILSTPWGRRPGLYLSSFGVTEAGLLPIPADTFKVGDSGIAKCHYHRSGFTSSQSEEGGRRAQTKLPPLAEMHGRQIGFVYAKFPAMLPLMSSQRTGDIVYVMDRPGAQAISLHVAVYDRQKVPNESLIRASMSQAMSFTSLDYQGFFIDVSATGLDIIMGFFYRCDGLFLPNSPEYSMNMSVISANGVLGAVGVQTEKDFARFGILDSVPDFSSIHSGNSLKPVKVQYPVAWNTPM